LVCPALGARLLRPEEVSAHVVREMLAIAGRTLGAPPTRAVITVPAYFNDAQRCAQRAPCVCCVLSRSRARTGAALRARAAALADCARI
jgi:molecular chaperone DnaK (HSP70)